MSFFVDYTKENVKIYKKKIEEFDDSEYVGTSEKENRFRS